MLENVSWEVFLKLLGIALTCYYGVVVIRYFRSEVSSLLINRKSRGLVGVLGRNTTKSERASMNDLSALLAEIDRELLSNTETTAELIQRLRQKVLRYGFTDSNAIRKIVVSHLLLAAKAAQVDLKEEDILSLFSELQN
jgi:hypothetical protein